MCVCVCHTTDSITLHGSENARMSQLYMFLCACVCVCVSVCVQVLAAAQPYLTGNAEADQDILKFYIARQQLLSKLQASGTGPAVA